MSTATYRPIYKRLTCIRVECGKIAHSKVHSVSESVCMPCNCGSGVLVKVINGKETVGDNTVNPRVFFKRKWKELGVDHEEV